jgi:cell division protein FtsI (penicillin-binding protein 3)/stage V sporulation protein D (sporulation-specific penicillin-binding protein)
MNSNSIVRIRIILFVFCIFAFVIAYKLYSIQITNGKEYTSKANSQYARPSTTIFNRGSIFFELKDGTKISAAGIKEGYTLAINPTLMTDPQKVFDVLSTYIDFDREVFMEKANKIDDPYEEIVKRLDKEIGDEINALDIEGVILAKETWRVYSDYSLAAHSVGLIGYNDENKIAGRYGLERYYEEILARNTSTSKTNVFAEIFSTIKNSIFLQENKEADIVSSIEPTVESFLEKTLAQTQDKWGSDSIGGIIMDPKNGKIYAMASMPTFDQNNLKDIKDSKVFSNPIVEDVYEMGSIIKPLTMAVGIDTGAITESSTYDDTGFMELNGKKISNYDGRARGVVPVQEVLSQSLNIGAATIALLTGQETFSEYFKSFGLGELTGIDQPNEQRGIIKNLDSKRDIEIATASYGQGIAITPIETIRALATLANGGMLITPHLTTRFEYTDGTLEILEPPETRVLKKESTDDVTKMLVEVVDKSLKKGAEKMEHYSIAAKTGTAQIADPENKGYYADRYLHSFFGYFPAYNPRFIVFLYHVYPKEVDYASETLTDPFIQLTKFLINYYELPPDR